MLEHFGRAGRRKTHLGELVELNRTDTYLGELVQLNQSDTYLAEPDELNTQVSWTDTIMYELSWTNTHLDELNKLVRSSELVRPPEKQQMANLLSDGTTTNSIIPKVIIHTKDVQESIGPDGFLEDSKTCLFGLSREADKKLAKRIRWISTRP